MATNDLVSAINDLKDRLEDDGYRPGITEYVAHEWEVSPDLLLRKFTEAEGVPPEEYDVTEAIARKASQAIKEAKALSVNFAVSARRLDFSGRTVEITGLMVKTTSRRRVIVVALTREAVMGIDISMSTRGNPMEKFRFNEDFGGRDKLMEQLKATADKP